MSRQLKALAIRKQRLIIQAAEQRTLLSGSCQYWRQPLSKVDKLLLALDYIKKYPILVTGGGIALLSMTKSSRLLYWLRTIWKVNQNSKKRS